MKKCRMQWLVLVHLILFISIGFTASAQSNWEQLFYDDFQSGYAENWTLQEGWSVFQADTNYMLAGENHYWASCKYGTTWLDYSFKCKVNIQHGAIHLNFRQSDRGRYMFGLSSDQITLVRDDFWGTYTELTTLEYPFTEGTWHDIELIANQKSIQVYINGELMIQAWDERALEMGSIAFETLDSSLVYVDRVEVFGAPQKDPPEGYDWIRTGGPPGGLGYDIRIHPLEPNTVFVTDNPSGINKSYDGGLNWHQKNKGITVRTGTSLEGIPVFSVTIDPGNPDNLWCGTQNSKGIFKSEDCGETWIRKDRGITEGDEISFRGFAIHPTNSDIVLGAAEITTIEQGVDFNKTKGKIYKTVDGGENWYQVWEGNNLARVLLFDYLHPDTLYCSTGIFDREAWDSDGATQTPGGEGILRSYDGGENWIQINTGIENLYIGFLEMHPRDPQTLYAAAGNFIYHEGGIIYKTTDGGDNWVKLLEDACFSAVTVSQSSPDVVYALNTGACFRSADGGVNWSKYDKPNEGTWGPPGIKPGIPISAAVHPTDENKVFVNNYNGGNFLSTDGGKTWLNSSNGYTGADIRDIHVNPSDPSRVYAVGRNGAFKSVNGGMEWIGITHGVAELEFMCLSVPDQDFKRIYGVIDGSWNMISSADGAETWNSASIKKDSLEVGGGFHRVADLEHAPSDPGVIYAGMSHTMNIGNIEPDGKPGAGMYKSEDGGIEWFAINSGLETGSKIINVIAVHPDSADIVYIGTFSDGIYKSIDGGLSWETVNNGLGSSDIRSIAIDPENPDILYAGSGNGSGIYKSINGGDLWTESNYGLQLKCASYLSPFGKGAEGMDLDSRNPLADFQDYNSSGWTKVLDMVIDPSNTRNIYAADYSTGIHYSGDGGASWARINSGIALRTPTCLSISGDGTVLYAGISGDGVLRMVLGNKAPEFQLTIPDWSDTVTVFRGNTVDFEAVCFDLNDDSLVYSWNFDGMETEEPGSHVFSLITDHLDLGYYDLSVAVSDGDTSTRVQWVVQVREISTDIPGYDEGLSDDGLSQEEAIRIYPNPFTGTQEISYLLPLDAEVSIDVYNVLGAKIRILTRAYQSAGVHSLQWNGLDQHNSVIPAGIYILRFVYQSDQEMMIQERKVVYSH
ncbi:MAG: T9SS type A sorting domain-containing protein [Bacteroidota bacterium]